MNNNSYLKFDNNTANIVIRGDTLGNFDTSTILGRDKLIRSFRTLKKSNLISSAQAYDMACHALTTFNNIDSYIPPQKIQDTITQTQNPQTYI